MQERAEGVEWVIEGSAVAGSWTRSLTAIDEQRGDVLFKTFVFTGGTR